jgi:hypothetical protein
MKSAISFEKVRLCEEIKYEIFLSSQLNLPTVHSLVSSLDDERINIYKMCSYNLKLNREIGKDIFDIAKEIFVFLGFNKKNIDIYVSNEPDVNCDSYYSDNSGKYPHLIVIKKGLLESMTLDELKFVMGHEIGHLIFGHSKITECMQFLFPDYDNIPLIYRNAYEIYGNLAEISADRLGLIASQDIDLSIKTLFKLSSGIKTELINSERKNILRSAEKSFLYLIKEHAYISEMDHPANPIRIKALEAFYGSRTWKNCLSGKKSQNDNILNSKMADILSPISKSPASELESLELEFLASSGLLLMDEGKGATDEQFIYLNNILSQYIQWPPDFVRSLSKKSLWGSMRRSAFYIRQKYSWRSRILLQFLSGLIIRRYPLRDQDISIFINILCRYLNVAKEEGSSFITQSIQENYPNKFTAL